MNRRRYHGEYSTEEKLEVFKEVLEKLIDSHRSSSIEESDTLAELKNRLNEVMPGSPSDLL